MARKDHSLDQLIVDAAKAEFLEFGFQQASLHKIADRAGITTGALYTRYKNKDALFCSLVLPAMEGILVQLAPAEQLYMQARNSRNVEDFVAAIQAEEQICMDLLFQHYEECVLLFCRSDGSSLDVKISRMMAEKARQTVAFFQSFAVQSLDPDGIELIMAQQFSFYRQILLRGYTKERAISCMKTVDRFLEAGWKAIFSQIL